MREHWNEGEIIREIQDYCADLMENWRNVERDPSGNVVDCWTRKDGEHVASLLNKSLDPWGLFVYMDEKTGSSDVGYRTRDGREWFPILRQMRNRLNSGLFENLRGASGVAGSRW
jgi:hypothetical protein